MTAIDPTHIAREARRERRLARIGKAEGWFRVLGLPFVAPLLRAMARIPPDALLSKGYSA